MNDGVNTDKTIRIPSKQNRSIGRPRQTSTVWRRPPLTDLIEMLRSQTIYDNLALEIPNLDLLLGGGTQPVPVWGETKVVDDTAGLEGIKALALVEVPQHGDAVLTAGGTEGTVRGYADGVEVSGVTDEVVSERAGASHPDLDETVPSTTDDEGDLHGRAEINTGDPFRVAVTGTAVLLLVGHGELVLSQRVPELDGLVAGGGNDLSVVEGKGDGEDVFLVADEPASGLAGVDLPETECGVPRTGEGELTVGGDDYVGDEVVVSFQTTDGVSHAAFFWVFGGVVVFSRVFPYDDGFVAAGGED